MKEQFAEFIGTFWLVVGGCGSAVISALFPEVGIGFLGVSLAFGLTVLTAAYSLAHISGAHFNPAISIGLWAAGRFSAEKLPSYVISQLLGGIVGATVLYFIFMCSGKHVGDFAANGYGDHSPGGYSVSSAFLTELVLTFMFLMVVLGSTHVNAPAGFAGLAIGLTLTLVHLVSIPVTNTSVNPARSISQAIFVGDWAVSQLWLFITAPIVGALLAGVCYRIFLSKK